MATRRGAASTPPSLKPEQAIPVLEGHILQGEGQLWPERYDSPKRVEWIQTGRAALIAALGSDDAAIQAFGSAQCGVYGPDDTDETLHEQATRQLDSMIAILRSAIQQLRWKLPDPKQVFIPAGSPHDAYV